MKKIFSGVFLMLAAVQLHAQTGLYIKAGLGYAVPLAGQTIAVNGTPFNGSINYPYASLTSVPNTYDVKKASFSAGGQAVVGIGYMFTPHLGVELNVNTIISPRQFKANDSNVLNPAASDAFVVERITRNVALPFMLTPSLVYNTGGTKFSGYARGGIVLPLSIKLMENYHYVAMYGTDEYEKLETTCKFGAGFSGAMGANYKITGNISVWAEANIMAMSVYAKQSKVTQHTNSNIGPSVITPAEGTIIKYSNNGSYNYIGGTTSVSTNMPAYSIPFSNLGVAIGISVALQKQKEETAEHHQK